MRKSGLLGLLLAALLVILPVTAFGDMPDNRPYGLTFETKINVEEEVAGISGEMLAAHAVELGISSSSFLVDRYDTATAMANGDRAIVSEALIGPDVKEMLTLQLSTHKSADGVTTEALRGGVPRLLPGAY